MSDVFLSYASQDRNRIRPLVEALESAGLSVWWDREIQAGSTYDREIEAAIANAKSVVVVWSNYSIESEYVRSEVEDAASRDILVPVRIDDIQPPLAHRRRQSVNLVRWTGKKDQEFEKLLTGVRAKIDAPGASREVPPPVPTAAGRNWFVAVGLGLAVLIAIGYYYRENLIVAIAMNVPALYFGASVEQELAFTTSADGTRLAYATAGEGLPILHVLSRNTHLEKGQNAPMYDNDGLVALSARDNLFVMYDGRGVGLSDRNVEDHSLAARVSDIEAVVEAADLDQFAILAVSAGGPPAIVYAAQNPNRVTRLVLAGTFASLDLDDETRRVFERMIDLDEIGWHRPEVSNMAAEQLIGPDGDEVDKMIMGEFMRRSMDGPDVARFDRVLIAIDVSDDAQKIRAPTLVLHSPTDPVVPFDLGRRLASLVPGARFEIVEGGHMASSASTAATRQRALEFLNGH
jgi:pimeloyl-ACP methyl ester carboxylesterase